jgi:hypothetical protein
MTNLIGFIEAAEILVGAVHQVAAVKVAATPSPRHGRKRLLAAWRCFLLVFLLPFVLGRCYRRG